jgi:nitrate reductase gamma subunit
VSVISDFLVEKLPYITIIVFILGIVWRLNRWFSAPRDQGKIKFDPISSIKYIILDVILFRKQFKTDKLTWFVIFVFHMCIAGIMFGHMRGFYWWSSSLFSPFGSDFTHFMIEVLPLYVGWIFIGTQVILLLRRAAFERKKLQSSPGDYLVLILLLVTSIVGQGTRIIPPEIIPPEVYDIIFIPGLIVLHLEKVPNDLWFSMHVLTTQLFVMYTPFSKLVHIFSGVVTPAIYGSRRKEYGI